MEEQEIKTAEVEMLEDIRDDEFAQVARDLAAWRENRSHRHEKIPEDLWIKMAELCKTRMMSHVSHGLSVGHTQLKRYCEMLEIPGLSRRKNVEPVKVIDSETYAKSVSPNNGHRRADEAPEINSINPTSIRRSMPDVSKVEMLVNHPSGAFLYFDRTGLHIEYDRIDESLIDVLGLAMDCVQMLCDREETEQRRKRQR